MSWNMPKLYWLVKKGIPRSWILVLPSITPQSPSNDACSFPGLLVEIWCTAGLMALGDLWVTQSGEIAQEASQKSFCVTWLAGKSPMNGGFNRKITDEWSIFDCHV